MKLSLSYGVRRTFQRVLASLPTAPRDTSAGATVKALPAAHHIKVVTYNILGDKYIKKGYVRGSILISCTLAALAVPLATYYGGLQILHADGMTTVKLTTFAQASCKLSISQS